MADDHGQGRADHQHAKLAHGVLRSKHADQHHAALGLSLAPRKHAQDQDDHAGDKERAQVPRRAGCCGCDHHGEHGDQQLEAVPEAHRRFIRPKGRGRREDAQDQKRPALGEARKRLGAEEDQRCGPGHNHEWGHRSQDVEKGAADQPNQGDVERDIGQTFAT